MSFFDYTEEKKTEIILSESKKIEDVLNKDLLKTFGILHNIGDEFNLFRLKQEVIAKKGLFLDIKKKYALHIINKEGVPVDKLFIKGLVTERADYPSMTRKKIKQIVDMILKTENTNFTELATFIETSKIEIEELCKKRTKESAQPVKYNKAEYKKVPWQVLAMELWNKTMYNYFVPGTKGYLFRIKGIDLSSCPESVSKQMDYIYSKKVKYIAIPIEEEVLPEFFDLDLKAMMKFCWYDRIDEILKPIENMVYQKTNYEDICLWE